MNLFLLSQVVAGVIGPQQSTFEYISKSGETLSKVGDILFWQWEADFLSNIYRADWLTVIMKIFTYLGEGGVMWILLSILLAVFAKTRKCGFTMMLSMILTLIIGNGILKNCFARFRPCWIENTDSITFGVQSGKEIFMSIKNTISMPVKDYSFPSGHTMNGFTAAMCILFCTIKEKKKVYLGALAVIVAGIIAFSRMYLVVHWPTDIMGGIIVGTVTAIISFTIMDKKLWSVIDNVFKNVKKAIDRKKRLKAQGKE